MQLFPAFINGKEARFHKFIKAIFWELMTKSLHIFKYWALLFDLSANLQFIRNNTENLILISIYSVAYNIFLFIIQIKADVMILQ